MPRHPAPTPAHSALREAETDDFDNRAALLDQTRWANEFSWAEIQTLALYLQVRRYPEGTRVFNEGETARTLLIIISGFLEVHKEGASQGQVALARLGPGHTIGEMSLLDGEPRSASATAATECALLLLSEHGYNSLLEENPRLANRLLLRVARMVSQRLRKTSGLLAEFLS